MSNDPPEHDERAQDEQDPEPSPSQTAPRAQATESAAPRASTQNSATNTWNKRVPIDRVQQAQSVATAFGGAMKSGAESAVSTMGRGANRMAEAFSAPRESELTSLMSGADLPELEGDSLVAIARRLDREADLWRQISLAALSRAGWSDRVAQTAAVGAWLVSIAAAILGLIGLVLGAGKTLGNSALALASVLGVTLGALVVAWVSGGVRRTQGALAAAALDRADLAEQRLQRVGVILTLRGEDVRLYREALARLEQDTRGR